MNYPKGTTKAQWDQYEVDLKRHEEFIERYKFYLNRIVEYLKWQGPRMNKSAWTPDEIKDWVESEITASSSMNAPNRPGYYRAAND